MEANSSMSEMRRMIWRSAVLAGLLAAAVGVAWLLTAHHGRPVREAEDILRDIRRQGLGAYWPGVLETRSWFLLQRGGKDIGWEMTYRRRNPDGGFAGGMIRYSFDTPHPRELETQWTLSPDARRGLYKSSVVEYLLTTGGLAPRESNQAVIELLDGRLHVMQKIGRNVFDSQTQPPSNYLPEGLSDLVLREVARRNTRARFEMVIDNQPPDYGRTTLFRLDVRRIGPAEESPGGSRLELQVIGSKGSQMIVLDAEGNRLREEEGDFQVRAVTEQDVFKAFPNARQAFTTKEESI